MPKQTIQSGFTLLEIIVTLIVISLIAGFSIPIFVKNLDKAEEKRAALNLSIIQEAIRKQFTENDFNSGSVFSVFNWPDIQTINSNLETYVIDDGGVYSCSMDTPSSNPLTCQYQSQDGSWVVHFHETGHVDFNLIHCQNTACPTCSNNASGCDRHF